MEVINETQHAQESPVPAPGHLHDGLLRWLYPSEEDPTEPSAIKTTGPTESTTGHTIMDNKPETNSTMSKNMLEYP